MKTNLLKKALALVLSIMVVLTAFGGALSVFAEDEVTEPEVVVDPYGTEEDGIDTNGNDVFDTIDPVIGVKNLNFEEGLKYWSSKDDRNGAASYALKKYTIDGVTAYGFKTEWLGSQWDGVATVRMQLDGVKVGDTIQLALEYMIDERFTTPLNKFTYEKDGETVSAAASGHGLALYQFQEGSATTTTKVEWGNQYVNNTAVHGTWITEGCCVTVAAYDNPIVAVRIQDTRSEAVKEAHATILTNGDGSVDSPIYIKSIKLLKLNADGSYTNLQDGEPVTKYGTPLYGTEEDGITGVWMKEQYKHYANTGNVWATVALYPVVDGFKNGDFSEGFKYWGFRYADPAKAYTKLSDAFEITAEGALRFKGAARDDVANTSPTYMGIVKNRFSLPGVTKGDTLKVFMDVRNTAEVNSAFGLTLQEVNGGEATGVDTSYTDAEGNTVNYDNAGFNLNLAANTPWTLKTSDTLVVTNENPVFRITSQANSTNGGFEIDNIRITKLNADGVTYTDIVTGEECYGDGKVIGGTYEDGWSYTNNSEAMGYIGPFSELMNGDFTDGLKYWGSRAVGAGSDYADVLLDGTNPYINLNNGGNADAQYVGIKSSLFAIPGVKAGDKLALMYNYRNGDPTKYESLLSVRNNDTTDTTWATMKAKLATVMVAATDTTWGTAVNKNYLTVGEKISEWTNFAAYNKLSTAINDGPAFFIEFANNTTGVTMDIDNVQVVKYINDYTYETFDGKTIKFDPAWAGTFADGVTTSTGEHSQMNNNFNAEYGVVNGDFEKGLMYWGCSGGIGSTAYASTHVDLVTEDGNSYFKFDGTTQTYFRGMKSGAVFIPKAKLAIGDSVVIKFDAYDPNGDAKNVQFKFDSRWGNGASSNSGVNQCTQIADKGNGWKTYITQVKSPITAASEVTTQAPAEGDWAFYVSVQVAGDVASTAGFDNIELVKVIDKYSVQTLDDDTVITWDPAWAGTFEDGASVSTGEQSQMTQYINKDYYVVNGDFSKGLKFWGATGNLGSTCYGSTYVDLITEGDNHYVKFDGETRTYYNGFKSGRISIPAADLAIGDQVALVFDVYDPDNTGSFQLRLDAADGNGSTIVTGIQYATLIEDKGNGWKTYVGKFGTIANASNSTDAYAVKAGDWTYTVAGEVVGNTASTAAIDNLKIVKKVTDYSVIDLATKSTIVWTPAWSGTFNDGINAPVNTINGYYNIEYGVVNGDFSEGLKYWGVQGAGDFASSNADLKADGDNYYIQLDGEKRTGYAGFRSANLSIPAADLMVGDYVALKFDVYDPDNTAANVQIVLSGLNMNEANESGYVPEIRLSVNTLNRCKVIEDKGNGWKTVVSLFSKNIIKESVATKTVAEGDWQFVIAVEVISSKYDEETASWTKESTSNAAFDNFEIVRADRGGFGAEAPIVDLEGNAISEVTSGDVNLDGKVDLVDLVRAKKYASNIAGGITSPISFVCTDVDGSDAIDAADFTAIINKILGIVA